MEIGIVKQVSVEEEMRNSYLDYAMSVIIARALPDVRDGLKPSQRRILVAMHDLNLAPEPAVPQVRQDRGDTSGNYHPHGEAVIYPTLVRLAQPFNMRYPLVDGQGNFGSVDGDPPAAMRYTEARMTAARHGDAGGHRQGHRRLVAQLRRHPQRADRAAGPLPEPDLQRLGRHRRRHGDQHPAAQPDRGRRRAACTLIEQPRGDGRGSAASSSPARTSRPAAS